MDSLTILLFCWGTAFSKTTPLYGEREFCRGTDPLEAWLVPSNVDRFQWLSGAIRLPNLASRLHVFFKCPVSFPKLSNLSSARLLVGVWVPETVVRGSVKELNRKLVIGSVWMAELIRQGSFFFGQKISCTSDTIFSLVDWLLSLPVVDI